MEKSQKKNKGLQLFIIFGMIAIIILMGFLVKNFAKIDKEGTACMSSPFVWGARKVAEKEGSVTCSCTTSSSKTFTFNEEKMSQVSNYGYYTNYGVQK